MGASGGCRAEPLRYGTIPVPRLSVQQWLNGHGVESVPILLSEIEQDLYYFENWTEAQKASSAILKSITAFGKLLGKKAGYTFIGFIA